MARVRDLWFNARPDDSGRKVKTARHPDNGGDPDARRWLAVWVLNGREITEAFTTKKAAAGHASRMQADIERGEYVDPSAGRGGLEPLARKWLRLREVTAGTSARYESVYRVHVAPVFGKRPVGEIRPSEVAEWSKSLAGQPETRRLALIVLRGILGLAVADGVRKDNPAQSEVVGKPVVPQLAREPWPAGRLLAVADGCAPWSAMVLTDAGLGLREGELFGLSPDDVDGGVVHVRRQVFSLAGELVFKLPKGGKVRDVPLPRGVGALLGQQPGVTVSLPWLAEDGKIQRRPLATVRLAFTDPDGLPWRARTWERRVWTPALKAAGVPVVTENGSHAPRHWYSTTLLDAGVSLAGVMEFMGHSRKHMPLAVGTYGHVTPETLEAARNAVDSALFRLRSVSSNGTVTELRTAR